MRVYRNGQEVMGLMATGTALHVNADGIEERKGWDARYSIVGQGGEMKFGKVQICQ